MPNRNLLLQLKKIYDDAVVRGDKLDPEIERFAIRIKRSKRTVWRWVRRLENLH